MYDDADVISRTLDGAEEAFFELALALGQLLTHPLDSLAALREPAGGLAALIASSPEYFERFRLHDARASRFRPSPSWRPHCWPRAGAAVGTTRTLAAAGPGTAEATVPVLPVARRVRWCWSASPCRWGASRAVLSGGPGAALILHRANTASQGSTPAPPKGRASGPPRASPCPARAARYQQQISGRPVDEAYWVGGTSPKAGGVKFDGFKDGVLLEAKGPGYANKFLDNLEPKPWFKSSGADQLRQQAVRQSRAAKGVPIRWHVAEKEAAEAIRDLLNGAKLREIEVVHTPALP